MHSILLDAQLHHIPLDPAHLLRKLHVLLKQHLALARRYIHRRLRRKRIPKHLDILVLQTAQGGGAPPPEAIVEVIHRRVGRRVQRLRGVQRGARVHPGTPEPDSLDAAGKANRVAVFGEVANETGGEVRACAVTADDDAICGQPADVEEVA